MDDDDFLLGPDTYDVPRVDARVGQVIFVLSADLSNKDDYILEWAGEMLPLSADSDTRNSVFLWHPNWIAANVPALSNSNYETTLPVDGRVAVCLRTATQVCPRGTTTTTTPVTIDAPYASIGGGVEDLVFTLTRGGDTTEALDAEVTITQEQTWLSDLEHEVTFLAGFATEELTIEATEFSLSPSTTGDLTATVSGDGIFGGSDTVEIISISEPPFTISYDMPEYTFAENAYTDIYVVSTLNAAYPRPPSPSRDFYLGYSTREDTATAPEDYPALSLQTEIDSSVYAHARDAETDPFVARMPLSDFDDFAIVDDAIYEGPERFSLNIEASPGTPSPVSRSFEIPDGTTCTPICGLSESSGRLLGEHHGRGGLPQSVLVHHDDGRSFG